jgi:hypothetical protein
MGQLLKEWGEIGMHQTPWQSPWAGCMNKIEMKCRRKSVRLSREWWLIDVKFYFYENKFGK